MTRRPVAIRRHNPGAVTGCKNRERVRDYLARHLGATNVECSRALGLSAEAVGRHVADIRAEWLAE